MATIIINRTEYTIPEGERLNAIQMAKRVGIEVPYYCWHPALSVVANCRMCEIEVGSKDPKTGEIKMLPKLVPGCQTPAKDGTVLVTDSPKVKEHQRMIMEYLLINHPLDCPVCDQAGECGLQDYSYEYGQAAPSARPQMVVPGVRPMFSAIWSSTSRSSSRPPPALIRAKALYIAQASPKTPAKGFTRGGYRGTGRPARPGAPVISRMSFSLSGRRRARHSAGNCPC